MLAHHLANLARFGRISPVEHYVCHRFRVVYVENAKVACTAIKQALFPEIDHTAVGQDRFHEILRSKASFAPPRGEAAQYLHFSFFRDPLTRLQSCYRDKIRHDGASRGSSIFSLRFHRALFAVFGGVDVTRPDLGFAEFADGVVRIPDRLRDRHVMSQAPILRAVTSAERHFVGRQESLADDWARLAARTGLPPLTDLNRTHRNGAAPEPLPPATLERLRRAFREDFHLLGYTA